MSRQHFAVCVHIDAGSFSLLEQVFEVAQVVATDKDSRIVTGSNVHLSDFRIAIGARVGFVEQRHCFYTIFTGFHG
ncbi:hypothetical protein DSECCO2_625860 [anaerobic digester metagenome]